MGGFPLRLPEELALTLSHQWPWRELQIRQLASLLSPALPSPPSIIIHGPQDSGKSSVLTALLAAYNGHIAAADTGNGRDKEVYMNGYLEAKHNSVLPYAVVKCAECITVRHLLGKIVAVVIAGACASASFLDEDARRVWKEDTRAKAKCDHISSLPDVLRDTLDSVGCGKFVLVLDGIDDLREGGQMLLAALGRLGEL
ncbi:hypothetical protein ACJ72_06726, partial [Emergomyces africanus]